MRSFLVLVGLAVAALPAAAAAEFYVWRDAQGVKQISNVPPRCIHGNIVLAGCMSRMGPLADPRHIAALNEKARQELRLQERAREARAQADKARQVAAAARAQAAIEAAARQRHERLQDLRRQLDQAEDEAHNSLLHGHDVPGGLLDRIDRLRADLKAMQSPPGDS